MKKLASILLSGAVIMSSFASFQTASAAESERTSDSYMLTDIWEHWASEELDDLVNADIFKGFPIGEDEYVFKPNNSMTRAEFAAIIVRALELKPTGEGETFTDIPANHSLKNEIAIASDHGIIFGVDTGKFAPNEPVLREQMAAIIVRAFEGTIDFNSSSAKAFSDVPAEYWAKDDIAKASGTEIVKGINDTQFGLNKKATRAEAGVMLHRALQKEQSTLPNEDELKTIAAQSETASFPLFEANDIDGLLAHNETYFTGYQKVSSDELVTWSNEGGVSQTISFLNEPVIKVEKRSNRYAQVSLTADINISFEDDTTSFKTTMPYDATYYMKKIDGKWKIYHTDVALDLDEEEMEQLLAGE
ncbi:S-layer homology domain-containing protein [Halalkalibacter nanhaiisediminis]|uniref:S-layer family protein n=1 Tax=Halalkalibacter nanhaiisediminis TaxID=688079 RepID=A0A562QTD2_9BACI|nr:S-layer homology domain-containing protein [Halalkalibacter nanhaiisediminis]TWI59863.1 S-layer family protein [Halalkalibacter nanhaiisediminis]